MAKEEIVTYFASAERASSEDLARQAELFAHSDVTRFLDFVPDIILVLNEERQTVFGNKALLDMLNITDYPEILGLRLGELVRCRNADTTGGGCGTSRFCRYCGGVKTVLKSINDGVPSQDECRLLTHRDGCQEALDLHVWASPFELANERFIFFALTDIADEKRRTFLERIFLHDIMNTAIALRGFSDLISGGVVEGVEREDMLQRISFLSNRIIDEINAQRQLMAAENDELVLEKKRIASLQFLEGVIATYNREDVLDRRMLRIDAAAEAITMTSDERLLSRVIGNMIKNALEAAVPGETITAGCSVQGGHIQFFVNNPTYMPENIQAQVFNRSFSTKGAGRGLGTYSMKYLTEKYLNGSIDFVTSEEKGTTFTATYPLEF